MRALDDSFSVIPIQQREVSSSRRQEPILRLRKEKGLARDSGWLKLTPVWERIRMSRGVDVEDKRHGGREVCLS